MKQIAIMIRMAERARADVMLTEDRIYYRFATDDTLEDGDLPGLKERYLLVETRIREALAPQPGEKPVTDIKADVFIDNMKYPIPFLTEQSLKRIVGELTSIDDVFMFLRGFVI